MGAAGNNTRAFLLREQLIGAFATERLSIHTLILKHTKHSFACVRWEGFTKYCADLLHRECFRSQRGLLEWSSAFPSTRRTWS